MKRQTHSPQTVDFDDAQAQPGLLAEFVGTVIGHRDGHGMIAPEHSDTLVFIAPAEMRRVLHKDQVVAQIVRYDRKGRPEARIVSLLERSSTPVMGKLLKEGANYIVAPEDKRYGRDIVVGKPDAATLANVGKVVVVQLAAGALDDTPAGRITEVLGEWDDPGMEIEIAVRKYSVPHAFSDACLAATEALPSSVQAADWAGRVDLTDVPLVTIDGEDARDFDDAVYCEPCKIGRKNGFRLLVAIADVSHYVQSGAAIDVDAFERATSVYFPRRVIPMLPEKLSNGLCSLNPDVERLCMVCDMVVGTDGEVQAYQFYPAVMHSHARLTYTEVAEALGNTKSATARKLKHVLPELQNLHLVYTALLAARQVRGAVDFETTETQIICDDNGRITAIVPRKRNDAHRLIEEAMLAANVCAADFIASNGANSGEAEDKKGGKNTAKISEKPSGQRGLFRVHEGPTPEKAELLRQQLKVLGLTGQGLTIGNEPKPADFAHIAAATKERPDAQQIHTLLLRSMQQAIYTPINSGHFGLAYSAYTHFTSPIRRYPDLLVHRCIKAILQNRRYELPKLPAPTEALAALQRRLANRKAGGGKLGEKFSNKAGGKFTDRVQHASKSGNPTQPHHLQDDAWTAAGLHCSASERRADEASMDVLAWLKCKFMRDHLGEVFSGTVSNVTAFGLFVTLDTLYVDGLVHVTELQGEYYHYDEARQQLIGSRTGMCYALGTKLTVQVSRVDLDARKIDFRLVKPGEELLRLGHKPAPLPDKKALKAATKLGAKQVASKTGQKAVKRTGKKVDKAGTKTEAKSAASTVRQANAQALVKSVQKPVSKKTALKTGVQTPLANGTNSAKAPKKPNGKKRN